MVAITGAASGIGEATARRFAKEDASQVLRDLDRNNLNRAAESLDSANVATEVTDASDFADCETLVPFALGRFVRINVLVNNTGKE